MKKFLHTLMNGLVLIPILCIISACELNVPVKEMTEARSAIETAKKHDAEKYSAEEIQKAEALLQQSHDELTNEKADDARASALLAIDAAKNADKKALPLYAQERMDAADQAYNEAEKLYAAKFSPDKFTEAGDKNNTAKSAFAAGNFQDAADLAVEARHLAEEAAGESITNEAALREDLTVTGNRIEALKKDKMAGEAEQELKAASDSLELANNGMNSRDLREAYTRLDNAKKAADKAEAIIKKKSLYAEIAELRSRMAEIQKEKDSGTVTEDIDKAMLALNGADAALEQDKTDEAEMQIKQARQLLEGSNIKMKQNAAAAALDNADRMLATAREKDADGKYTENLNRAGTLISDGRELAAKEKYNDAIGNADEAETIIAAVLNSIETDSTTNNVSSSDTTTDKTDATADSNTAETKDSSETTDKSTADSEKPVEKYYVVQWRKKNTDCLWRIAEKEYNDATLWPIIYMANREQIKNPDLIFPGQKFLIPEKPDKKPSRKELKEMLKKEKPGKEEKTGK